MILPRDLIHYTELIGRTIGDQDGEIPEQDVKFILYRDILDTESVKVWIVDRDTFKTISPYIYSAIAEVSIVWSVIYNTSTKIIEEIKRTE